VFPVSYAAVDEDLPALMARHRPQVVLMFGLAARSPFLGIETRARNACSVLLPDAAGRLPAHGAIAHDARPARPGRAPFVPLVAAVRRARVTARLSHDAGRYLCNYLYWRALEPDAAGMLRIIVFVHVPKLGQGARPLTTARIGDRGRRMHATDLARAAEALLCVAVAAARRH
jgi:pyroglutamyl-peptidase